MVPVPLDASRRRRRGFNQAELIADAVAARTGLGVCDCLERCGPAATQVGRGRRERALAAAGAIGVRADLSVPAEAVLVDDVVTTGATLAACAAAPRIAGAAVRGGLSYARTPGR